MENQKKEPIIIFDNVCLSFGKKQILKNISFEIYKSEIVCIVGLSGIGKSTILNLITKLLYPDSGTITVNADTIGMAFQHAALFNSMTVWENVALALKETTNLSKKEIATRVMDALNIVSMENTINLFPTELSGGMQKRVSVARALALHPDIVLYDEPSTGLDPITAAKLEYDMVRLRDKLNFTSVVVTHDINTIQSVSDRVMILDNGHIVWNGALSEFMNDDSIYPKKFRERKDYNNNNGQGANHGDI